MKHNFKRTLSLLMALVMALSCMSLSAFADVNVAQIGETGYETLEAAFATAESGDTIKLLSTINYVGEGIEIAGKAITLDMDGKTITFNNCGLFDVSANGDLTITGNGTITGPTGAAAAALDGKALIYIGEQGALTIENGTLTAGGVDDCGMYGIYAYDDGTVTLGTKNGNGPTITSWFAPIGENHMHKPATFVIYSGAYTSQAAPAATDWWSYFCAPIYAAAAGSITINGGEFNGYYAISDRYVDVVQTLTINGGTFNGTSGTALFVDDVDGSGDESDRTIAITGGTFNDLSALGYLASGAEVEIELDKDVTLTETCVIPEGMTVTLDLSGHDITCADWAIQSQGDLTIKDSVGGGVITSTANCGVNAMGTSGKLTIQSGTITAQEMAVMAFDGATVVINGGTFNAIDNAVIGTNGTDGRGNNNITINGGTFNGGIQTAGYVACGIYAPNNDTWNITGGTFNITGGAGIVARAGTVNVGEGVTINTTGSAIGKVGDSNVVVPCAALVFDSRAGYPGKTNASQIAVSGGMFTSQDYAVQFVNAVADANQRIAITGGTFSSKPDAAYVASGNKAYANADGTYTVAAAGAAVASIGSDEYLTLPDAVKVALRTSGNTEIDLLGNASGDGFSPDGAETGEYTIDFQGHTYTVTGLVGSTGTVSQAWRVIKGQTATLKNGTLTSSTARMLVNNYGNLTLDGMKLDGSELDLTIGAYTLSDNNGTVVIKDTEIIAKSGDGNFAFDVWGAYPSLDALDVTVKGNSVIRGEIEYTAATAPKTATLTVEDGIFSSDPGAYVVATKMSKLITDGDNKGMYRIVARTTGTANGAATEGTVAAEATATLPATANAETSVTVTLTGTTSGSVTTTTDLTPGKLSAATDKANSLDDGDLANLVASAVAKANTTNETTANAAVAAVAEQIAEEKVNIVGKPIESDVTVVPTGLDNTSPLAQAMTSSTATVYNLEPFYTVYDDSNHEIASGQITGATSAEKNAKLNGETPSSITVDAENKGKTVTIIIYNEDGSEGPTVSAVVGEGGVIKFNMPHFSYVGTQIGEEAVAYYNDGLNDQYYSTLHEAVEAVLANNNVSNKTVHLIGMIYDGDIVTLQPNQTVTIVYAGGTDPDTYDYHQFIRVEAEVTPGTTNYINTTDSGTAYTFTCTSANFTITAGDVSVANGTEGANYIKDNYNAVQTVSVPVTVSGGTFYGVNFTATFNPNYLTFGSFASAIDGVTYEVNASATAGVIGGTLYSSVPLASDTTVGTLTFTVAADKNFNGNATEAITINAAISPDYNREVVLNASVDLVSIPIAYAVTFGAYVGNTSTPAAATTLTAKVGTTTVIDASAAETSKYVIAGTQLTLAQTTANGYEFINFTSGTPNTMSNNGTTFTVPTQESSIKANYYSIFTVTVTGTGVTETTYKVRGGFALGADNAIVTTTGHETLNSTALGNLVDTSKYILRSWTFGTEQSTIATDALLAKVINANVTVTANTAKWYAVTQSQQTAATHEVKTTGASATTTDGKAYADEAYTITLADENKADPGYDTGYTYTLTVTKSDNTKLVNAVAVPTTGADAGKYTIPAATLAGLAPGETLTVSVIKSLTINVKVYSYVNNLVLVTAWSGANVPLDYYGEALYTDSLIANVDDETTYVMLLDVGIAGFTASPTDMDALKAAITPHMGFNDALSAAAATPLNSLYDDAKNVNLSGTADIADIADITLVYGAYKNTYSYQTNAKGVVKYHDVQYFLSDVTFRTAGDPAPALSTDAAQVNMTDVQTIYEKAYGN